MRYDEPLRTRAHIPDLHGLCEATWASQRGQLAKSMSNWRFPSYNHLVIPIEDLLRSGNI